MRVALFTMRVAGLATRSESARRASRAAPVMIAERGLRRSCPDEQVAETQRPGEIFVPPAQLLFEALAIRHVAREAAGMDESALAKQGVGVDEDVLDRSVLAPDPGLVVLDRLLPAQAAEDVGDDLRVRMEPGDVASDVLVFGVAEHRQLRPVCPEDGAVWTHPVKPLDRVLQEVDQILLARAQGLLGPLPLREGLAQLLLQLLALLDLVLQRASALLKPRHLAQAFVGIAAPLVRLGREHVRMCGADLLQVARVRFPEEVPHHVGAKKRERLQPGEVVPQLFEADGGLCVPLPPEEIDHLSVGAHPRRVGAPEALLEDGADVQPEAIPVGHPADHEGVQGAARIAQRQGA
jgi:hypothetical protein